MSKPINDYSKEQPCGRSINFRDMDDPKDQGHRIEVSQIMSRFASNWCNAIERFIEDKDEPFWQVGIDTEESLCIGFEEGMTETLYKECMMACDMSELQLIKVLCKRQGITLPPMVLGQIKNRNNKINSILSTSNDK